MTIRFLVSPNTFKGSLGAVDVASLLVENLACLFASSDIQGEIQYLPVADGGDDTVRVLASGLSKRWETKNAVVTGPIPEIRAEVNYLHLPDQRMVVIEAAQAHGLAMLQTAGVPLDALAATSYGVGEVMLQALAFDPKILVLSLGGSASTDGGLGALQTLGYKLLDADKTLLSAPFQPRDFEKLHSIEPPAENPLKDIKELLIATDTMIPLLGPEGTARIFAPQKGASPEQCEWLEKQLHRVSDLIDVAIRKSRADVKGAGAAGGLGYGLLHLPNASIVSGFYWLAEQLGLQEAVQKADVIVTGEGCFDATSSTGKAVGELLAMAEQYGKPVLLICGEIKFSANLSPQVLPLQLVQHASAAEAIASPDKAIAKLFEIESKRILAWLEMVLA